MVTITFFVAIIRIIASVLLFVIARDTTRFITMAYAVTARDLNLFMSEQYHPLYALLIYCWHFVFPGWVQAAKAAALAMSVAGVFPVYMLCADLFGKKTGRICAILFAVHPYVVRFGVDGLSESTYTFLLMFGLWIGYRAMRSRGLASILLFASGGVLFSLAYLTRPEGVGGFLVIVLATLVYGLKKNSLHIAQRIGRVCVIGLAFTLFTTPYLYMIQQYTGEWRFTQKKAMRDFVPHAIGQYFLTYPDKDSQKKQAVSPAVPETKPQPETPEHSVSQDQAAETVVQEEVRSEKPEPVSKNQRKSFYSKKIVPALEVLNTFINTLNPLLFCFFLAGMGMYIRSPKTQDQRLLSFILFSAMVLYLYVLYSLASHHYVSKRHLLPVALLALPFAAHGICRISELRALWKRFPAKIAPLTVIMVICALVLLPKALKPQRANKMYLKEIGKWINAQEDTSGVFAVDDSRIPFYAQLDFVVVPRSTMKYEQWLDFLAKNQVRYVLTEKEFIEMYFLNLEQSLTNDVIKLKSIYKSTDNKNGAVEYCLYEYFPPDSVYRDR
ncbi:MAG: hypothetical protein C4541_05235 [Candidatus Auribacter fodinae]|uniref:Glycosyltransferase RgtA/B/C/D-like domain-containing protein n=1 Tax=Candidatus Auribacter fodinae TaxID=2093366 RepID=A0A3A4R159_9BACT|nr:MAG: hypothetical protein C4541_05235 [Candidatus Auribacter fodinae]